MAVFDDVAFDNHERVVFINDDAAGLHAIIAVHNTALGRAGGGTRMYPYNKPADALHDVLRLSRAMTYKFALGGVPFGGGKSVIIGNPASDKNDTLLEAFGRAVDSLKGLYTCAEDVGTTPDDMAVIHRETRYVAGLPDKSGDTSPLTGLGVYRAILAAAKYHLGKGTLEGLTVAVQGAGNVGKHLTKHLVRSRAKVVIADIDERAVARVVSEFGSRVVSPQDIYEEEVDIFAPCALGAVLNDDTIPRLRAGIVCGGANNQLAEDRHAQVLADRGIFYVPDYVANAGGIFSGSTEALRKTHDYAISKTEAIYETCMNVFTFANEHEIPPAEAADRMARKVLDYAKTKSEKVET